MNAMPEQSQMEPLWRELVGRFLREQRTAQGKTLVQVAERAGISPQYLSELERGLKEPSSEMLASICGALGIRLVDVLQAGTRLLIGQHIRLGGSMSSPVSGALRGPVLLAA